MYEPYFLSQIFSITNVPKVIKLLYTIIYYYVGYSEIHLYEKQVNLGKLN